MGEVSEHDGSDSASNSRRGSVHETGNELGGSYEGPEDGDASAVGENIPEHLVVPGDTDEYACS
jgi:hypothetical protein